MAGNDKDIYYIDYFNLVAGGTGQEENLTNTIRLYTTTNNGDLSQLIAVAPYLEPPSFSGMNTWENAGTDLFSMLQKGFADGRQEMNNLVKEGAKALNGVRETLAEGAAKITGNRDNAATKWLQSHAVDTASFEKKIYANADFQKTFGGSTTTIPTELTATYLSDADGFKWYKRANLGKTPLKNMCKDLYKLLVGQFEDPKKGAGFNLVSQAPNNFACNTSSWNGHVQGSFTLCMGEKIVVKELLPESLIITPSRLETTDGDYYTVTISITMTAGRLLLPNEVASWI